jgi:hypothetical protein
MTMFGSIEWSWLRPEIRVSVGVKQMDSGRFLGFNVKTEMKKVFPGLVVFELR